MTLWLGLAGLYAALHGLRLWLSWRYLRAQPSGAEAAATVLQPILSGDPDLAQALAVNLRNAPEAQFVWLIDQDDPEAHRIAQESATAQVMVRQVPGPRDGENPKLKKLIIGAGEGAGAVVVLDDDTVLRPGGAMRLAGRAEQAQGLATAIPVWGHAPRNGAEALVAGFINGQGVSSYFAMSALGRNKTINGMAYAIPREVLAGLGGFAAAGHEVTDDWAVARLAQRGGVPLVQTAEPAEVAVTLPGWRAGAALLRRWMLFAHRYMAANIDAAMVGLIVLPGLLPLLGLGVSLGTSLWAVALWIGLLWGRAALHLRLVAAVAGAVRTPRWAVVLAELLLPLMSLAALVRPKHLRWRSREMALDAQGRIRFK